MSANINKSLVAFLVDEGKHVQGITAIYDQKAHENGTETPTFYKAPSGMQINEGDIVLVPTSKNHRVGFTTNKVVKVGVSPDFNSPIEVKWIAGVIGTDGYHECIKFEEAIIEKFKAAEQRKLEEQMRETMKDVMGDVMDDLPALPGA